MITTVYLVNSSRFKSLNINYIERINNDEKVILTIDSEEEAKKIFNDNQFDDISKIFTSNHIVTQELAKYISLRNDLKINSTEKLNERKIGNFDKLDGLDLGIRQTKDFDFRLNGGESLNQVKQRMTIFLKKILSENSGSNIVIISHNFAIMSLLLNWCSMDYNLDNKVILTFKDNVIYDERSTNVDILKITFDELKLKNIELIDF